MKAAYVTEVRSSAAGGLALFYVSVREAGRVLAMVGPFRSREAALVAARATELPVVDEAGG